MFEDNHFGVWRQLFWCCFLPMMTQQEISLVWKIKWKRFIPSRSSMVFSSLATDLSANSARVSAWREEDSQASAVVHEEVGSVANNQHFYAGGRWTCKSTGCFNLPPWVCPWEPWSPPRICLPFASTVFAQNGQNEVNIFKMEWLIRFHSFKKVIFFFLPLFQTFILTFSAWASRDFRLFCTVFSSSSSSEHLLQNYMFNQHNE